MNNSTNIKVRPILFDGESVRAILAGRKTQTRRRFYDGDCARIENDGRRWSVFSRDGDLLVSTRCPYGAPGDNVWVKETWAKDVGGQILYRATEENYTGAWKQSIFMPRSACRLILRIEDVRVERLQAITDDDIVREGLPENRALLAPREWFRLRWNALHEASHPHYSWERNPLIWVLQFYWIV